MSPKIKQVIQGLAWVLFSPLVLLMGMLGYPPEPAPITAAYYVGIALAGAWSLGGIAAGVATIAQTAWAHRLRNVLTWILAIYFIGSFAIGALYLIVEPASRLLGVMLLCAVGASAWWLAIRTRRQRTSSPSLLGRVLRILALPLGVGSIVVGGLIFTETDVAASWWRHFVVPLGMVGMGVYFGNYAITGRSTLLRRQ
jgi:hypothetical protein